MNNINTIEFDALIIGGGGSGMRASLVSKVRPKDCCCFKFSPRSHTVSAQGGITCAIASADPNDDWRWHMYDTVKGADFIGDQDAIEYLCSEGQRLFLSLNIWAYLSLDSKTVEFIKDLLEVNQRFWERWSSCQNMRCCRSDWTCFVTYSLPK